MTHWPRTLFGRTALVVGTLILLTELSTLPVLDFLSQADRTRRLAELEAGRVRMALAGYRALSEPERGHFAEELRLSTGVRVAAGPTPRIRPIDGSGFLGALARAIRGELGEGSEVYLGHEGTRGLWVRARAEEGDLWVFLPAPPPRRGFRWELVAAALAALALAALGAVAIVWRIGRPLRDLTEAARRLGTGESPPPLPLKGPEEIRALSESFNQMGEDLRRLAADRELLLSGVSHDLGTPLTRLRLGLEMLPPGVDRGAVEGMITDVSDAEAIAAQLRSFAEAEREPAVSWPLDELISHVAGRYSHLGVPMALHLAPLPQARFRPVALQRLLTNLLDNAFKHGGGGAEVRTSRRNGSVVVSVLDRGPGMSGAEIERLTRIPPAAGARTGRGLGLAVAARLARAHGTRLDVRNRQGGGLEASFELELDGD